MAFNLLTQWLSFGNSSLDMYKQLASAGDASLREAGATAGPAQLAQLVKKTLELSKQWSEAQSDAYTALFRTQLSAFDVRLTSDTVLTLMDLQTQLSSDLAAQSNGTIKGFAQRAQVCLNDLQEAQTKDEVSMVVAGFLTDVGGVLRSGAEETVSLLNSAQAASGILTHKALDEMAQGKPVAAG
ncbi:hypothetical protein [Janthinobacterium sp.]|uniref:hypothetical protein n=1 Tax=Janthinobacterium sp. TaxID=1871054 RepID=UPI002611996F|nr:hypothetical protein [Janthinobacterium sp.]